MNVTETSEHKSDTSWENLFMSYANNKAADQPAHPRSLVSVFFLFAAEIV